MSTTASIPDWSGVTIVTGVSGDVIYTTTSYLIPTNPRYNYVITNIGDGGYGGVIEYTGPRPEPIQWTSWYYTAPYDNSSDDLDDMEDVEMRMP